MRRFSHRRPRANCPPRTLPPAAARNYQIRLQNSWVAGKCFRYGLIASLSKYRVQGASFRRSWRTVVVRDVVAEANGIISVDRRINQVGLKFGVGDPVRGWAKPIRHRSGESRGRRRRVRAVSELRANTVEAAAWSREAQPSGSPQNAGRHSRDTAEERVRFTCISRPLASKEGKPSRPRPPPSSPSARRARCAS